MRTQLGAAVVGTGFMGAAHTEALRRLGIEVRGILGSNPEKTQSSAEKLGLPRAYTSFEEICQDGGVDVVHLCTPNYLHRDEARAALLAGKHVLCEKPLAMNASESAELVALARERHRVGAVNHNLRYYPLCQEARARVQAGEIGEVRIIHGAYLQDWLFFSTDWNWRLQPDLGGDLRVVGDIGTHWMDMAAWVSGSNIRAVMADFATFIPVRQRPLHPVETFAGKLPPASKLEEATDTEDVEIHTEDYAAILFEFQNGARGNVTLSQISAGRKNHFWWEIHGSKGSMKWEQERPNELWLGYRERENGLVLKDPALMSEGARRYAGYPGGHAEGYPDSHMQLFRDLYEYIEAGNFEAPRPFPTFEDGWRGLALCEAVKRSAMERRWVEIDV